MSKFEEKSKNVLVTGGTGYIGTHTVLCLIVAGFDVTVVDNLINSSKEGLKRVQEITGCDESRIRFFNADLCDKLQLESVFQQCPRFTACIHFAALKAVGESVQKPLLYYENNLMGTLNLVNLLDKYGCHTIVFSSSATVSLCDIYCHSFRALTISWHRYTVRQTSPLPKILPPARASRTPTDAPST